MIAIAFLLVIVVVVVIVSVTSGGTESQLPITELIVLSLVFAVFFLSGIYVAAALGVLATMSDLVFSARGMNTFFGQVAWATSNNFVFVAVPFFLLMGEILLRAGLSDRLYRALNLWVGWLPGGLLHTNIASSAVFSAVTGSSVACAATVGSVALPYFNRTNYPVRMVMGSLAAGGALGNLIPPGIAFIIYGLFTDTSIGQLYAAGMVAGLMTAGLLMFYIFLHSVLTRAQYGGVARVAWRERFGSIVDLIPSLILIFVVLGLLYLGLATATEVSGLGVVGALGIAALYRRLNLKLVHDAVRATARTTSMVGLIIIAALLLNFVLSGLRLPAALAAMISSLPLPPPVVMLLIIFFYLGLGTFMDGFAMMVTTLPVMFPVVVALGYDPVWFGVVITMVIEIALISPPDGMVMYVLQGLRKPPGPISDVFYGVIPFLGVFGVSLLIMYLVPQIILWPIQ